MLPAAAATEDPRTASSAIASTSGPAMVPPSSSSSSSSRPFTYKRSDVSLFGECSTPEPLSAFMSLACASTGHAVDSCLPMLQMFCGECVPD